MVFALAILCMILSAATEPLFAALMQPLLDKGFNPDKVASARWIPWAIVGLFLFKGVFGFATNFLMNWISQHLVKDLRTDMFSRLIQLPVPYFDANNSGTLISKILWNVNEVTSAGTTVVTSIIKDSCVVIGILIWLFMLNWQLTLVTLTMIPIIAVVIRLSSKRLRKLGKDGMDINGDLVNALQETIDGQKIVKVYGGQKVEHERFEATQQRFRRTFMKTMVASSLTSPVTQSLTAIALAVVIGMGMSQAAQGAMTVGGFVSFLTSMTMLFAPLRSLAEVNNVLQKGLAAAENAFTLIDEATEKDQGQQTLGRARGTLEFRNVSLAYADASRPALAHINLTILSGETVAFVGASGGGKTSLVNLIPRFYTPTDGQILLDGIALDDLTLTSLREQLAMVNQDVVLFNDTIAGNIAYGAQRGASRADIEKAAEAAYLTQFIGQLPAGLDTEIGENGVRLSGGQRQRIAIARALLKNAPILILDEATSALDSESEKQIQLALDTLIQGRTTLVIAHRLSTIEKADRIVVMDKGEIREVGRHAELLAQNGLYANLYRIQYASET